MFLRLILIYFLECVKLGSLLHVNAPMIRLVRPPQALRSQGNMYDSISDFLTTLSDDSPGLWAALVLGVVATLALALYVLWELILQLMLRLVYHLVRTARRTHGTHRSRGRS